MEIKVGEYCKLKNGRIGKIVNENIDVYLFDIPIYEDQQGIRQYCLDKNFKDFIVKHSKNIIDLIEVGDYVNGEEVITVYGYDEDGNDKDGLGICEIDDDYAYYIYLEDINIRTIVTKEQFKNIEYRLEN